MSVGPGDDLCIYIYPLMNLIYFHSEKNYRWNSPISIALHAPGTDFIPTVNSIKYLRDCLPESSLVRQFVTFHIYFSSKHVPKIVSICVVVWLSARIHFDIDFLSFLFIFITARFLSKIRFYRQHTTARYRHPSRISPHRSSTRLRRSCSIPWMWDAMWRAMQRWHISF